MRDGMNRGSMVGRCGMLNSSAATAAVMGYRMGWRLVTSGRRVLNSSATSAVMLRYVSWGTVVNGSGVTFTSAIMVNRRTMMGLVIVMFVAVFFVGSNKVGACKCHCNDNGIDDEESRLDGLHGLIFLSQL